MESVTHFHTRIFSLYAHFYRTLEKDQIETLLKWARIVLPKISNVSIEPETLEVSVPEMKRLKIIILNCFGKVNGNRSASI